MSGTIYLLHDDGKLIEMNEQFYDSEDLLQRLLASHPNLLAGDQIDTTNPRRWLLVTREAAIPSEANGSGRWSLDHLLLDQDGIPTFVEVKRSSNTQIRREVVGQMLDYAANAVIYWSVDTIRTQLDANCIASGRDPQQVVAEFLSPDIDANLFWQQVKTNLQAGKVRLLFVADSIPPELQRIVEFLNQQMNPAEVLAVEIKQFVGEGRRTLVPRVLGQTIAAQQIKQGTTKVTRKWDEASFFQDLTERHFEDAVLPARDILRWGEKATSRVWWGEGATLGAFVPIVSHKKRDHQLFAVWSNGVVEIYFYWYAYKPPFDSEDKRHELRQLLNTITGVNLPVDAINKRPSFPLRLLGDATEMQKFIAAFQWVIQEIRAS